MKKQLLVLCGVSMALFLIVGTSVHIYRQQNPKEYMSNVNAQDCLLCGTPNEFRGTEALGFVVVSQDRWNFDNIGMIQYCREDQWEMDGCVVERIKDEALSEEELLHKHAPFDINGVFKQAISGPFTRTRYFYRDKDRDTFGGALDVKSENGLITGAFDISRCKGADADYLCSVLCQVCFDKVYPVTREVNFFLVDSKTGDIFSLYHAEEPSFQIRDYSFHIQLRDFRSLIFYATHSVTDV